MNQKFECIICGAQAITFVNGRPMCGAHMIKFNEFQEQKVEKEMKNFIMQCGSGNI